MSEHYYTLGRSGLRVSRLALGKFIQEAGVRDRVVVTTKFTRQGALRGLLQCSRLVCGTGSDARGVAGMGTTGGIATRILLGGAQYRARIFKNPAFMKFTERNRTIVAALDSVAQKCGRSMAQVALNWAANRPGIASLIIGATKLDQLQDNLQALEFTLPPELRAELDAISRPQRQYPYFFFENELQRMIHGGAPVGDKPDGYRAAVRIETY